MKPLTEEQNRRSFLLRFAGVSAGFLALGGIGSLAGCEENTIKPVSYNASFRVEGNTLIIDVPTIPPLASPGGYAQFDAKDFKLVVIRLSDTAVSALSRECTHAGCDVNPGASGTISGDRFVCGCHGSSFALADGSVLRGPATDPLQQFPAVVAGNTITVDLS